MTKRNLALYISLILIAGFAFGQISILDNNFMDSLGNVSSVIAALASLFTAWVAMQALSTWREPEKFKEKKTLSIQAFMLLSDIQSSSKRWGELFIKISHPYTGMSPTIEKRWNDEYLELVDIYNKQISEYLRLYAHIKLVGIPNMLSILDDGTSLSRRISEIISDANNFEISDTDMSIKGATPIMVIANKIEVSDKDIDQYIEPILDLIQCEIPKLKY